MRRTAFVLSVALLAPGGCNAERERDEGASPTSRAADAGADGPTSPTPSCGGEPVDPPTLVAELGEASDPTVLRAFGDRIYWARAGAIKSVSRDGSDPREHYRFRDAQGTGVFLVSETGVYVDDRVAAGSSANEVVRVAPDGSTTTLTPTLVNAAVAAVTRDAVYVTSYSRRPEPVAVHRITSGGGAPMHVGDFTTPLVVADDWVWEATGGEVRRQDARSAGAPRQVVATRECPQLSVGAGFFACVSGPTVDQVDFNGTSLGLVATRAATAPDAEATLHALVADRIVFGLPVRPPNVFAAPHRGVEAVPFACIGGAPVAAAGRDFYYLERPKPGSAEQRTRLYRATIP